MKTLVVLLLLLAPVVVAQIPSRTLLEVGCGPVLLIGVKDYDRVGSAFDPLPGINQDLKRMEATVRQLGFTDITVLKDPSREKMLGAMNAFGEKLSNSEKTSFFYYSGHGVLQDKLNYLIPAKAQVMARGHLKNYAVPFEHVTGFVGQQTKGPCLFFIDACRNNTLPAGNKASSDGSLLVQRKGGVFVGFATGEGQTSQASLTGSPYTESLSKRLLLPGASLDDLYFSVIADVEKVTNEDPEYFQPPEKVSGLRYRFTLAQIAATKENPFSNSLGMKFVPAGTPGVFFSVWEARVGDFRKFVTETDYDAIESSTNGNPSYTLEEGGEWKQAGGSWKDPRFPASAKQNDEHPVVCVSYLDAESFCAWLTKKERASGRIPANASYRLPTDGEWSRACGLGKYPWGNTFPPKRNEGNYNGKETMIGSLKGFENEFSKAGRADGAGRTSAVGMYGANRYGLHDMGGNVFEWCGTWYRASLNEADALEKLPFLKNDQGGETYRVLRGGSWYNYIEILLRSSFRIRAAPRFRNDCNGFRCVLSVG